MTLQKYIWPFEGMHYLDDYLNTLDKMSGDHGFPKWEQWIDDDWLVVQFLVAGYSKEDFSIEAQSDSITVEARKTQKHPKSKFAGRAFKQSLKDVHGKWNFNEADISYENGILKIEVPMKKEAHSHKLKIR